MMLRFSLSTIFLLLVYIGFAQYATYMVVASDGSGDYKSIQEAINATKAFPEKDITIFIRKGIYKEKVRVYAWNTRLKLVGEDRDQTIVTWDDHFDKINLGRNSTFHTYTFQVEANDVVLENLTIRNTAGPVGQAVALHVDADRVTVKNCNIEGHQDTLYVTNGRQYFSNCYITGTTDFIFGAATALFHQCKIVSKSDSYITAASTPRQNNFGLVFLACILDALPDVKSVYLGRPWRSYAKTVFLRCQLNAPVAPTGWDNWGSSEKEKLVFYAEYASSGPGAHPEKRVNWSQQLTKKEASTYTIEKVFDNWRP